MPWPANVSRTWPQRSRTIRQPAPETLPPCVGSEPTITQPLRSAVSAVVRPTPPGQPGRLRLILANCRHVTGRGDLDDRGSRALHVGLVVEVADQDVAPAQVSGAARDDRHPVRVDVAVSWHRRRDRGDVVQRSHEGREASGLRRHGRACYQAGRGGASGEQSCGERGRVSSCCFHSHLALLGREMSPPMARGRERLGSGMTEFRPGNHGAAALAGACGAHGADGALVGPVPRPP